MIPPPAQEDFETRYLRVFLAKCSPEERAWWLERWATPPPPSPPGTGIYCFECDRELLTMRFVHRYRPWLGVQEWLFCPRCDCAPVVYVC